MREIKGSPYCVFLIADVTAGSRLPKEGQVCQKGGHCGSKATFTEYSGGENPCRKQEKNSKSSPQRVEIAPSHFPLASPHPSLILSALNSHSAVLASAEKGNRLSSPLLMNLATVGRSHLRLL